MFVLAAGPRVFASDGVLERMASTLRGGDGAPRVWLDRERIAGAASLAPHFVPEDAFDLQPLVDQQRVFVCQARIDNRAELLQMLGVTNDVADSTLLAAAYDRWGAACVDRLAGDFAFAAWHRADDRIVAAVDPLGARRIFWTRIGDGIAVAGQLAALLAHPDVSHEPDLYSFARLLDIGLDRTSTPFTAIRSLPGGHLLVARGGDVRVERWWNPEWRASVWYRDAHEYVDETRELLTRAVAAQLRSSAPIATTLSGGLDSGCITAIAARLLPSRIAAYTAIPEEGLAPSQRPNWEPDDRAYAVEVVARFDNLEHHIISPAGRCVVELLPSIHERSRTAIKAATNLLWIDGMNRAVAASGSRVLLVGQQGNSTFSARGESAVRELAMSRHFVRALTQARVEARQRRTNVPRVLAGELRSGIRTLLSRNAGASFAPLTSRFLLRPPPPNARANEYLERIGTRRFRAAAATVPKHAWSPDTIAQWGVEWRDPLADRRLLERLLRYPQAAFRIGGRDRGLAREVANGLLPDRVRLRTTQGAQAPEAPSIIAAHANHYESSLNTMRNSPLCRELFNFDALAQTLRAFTSGERDLYLALALDRATSAGLFLASLEQPR